MVVIVARGEPGAPQVGVVAGRRVGNAVRRNRAKRRVRAALERVPLARDTTYVVIAGRQVVDTGFERLVSWIGAAVEDRPEEE